MIVVARCDECETCVQATEDLLSALRLQRGMALKDIRIFLFRRHGLDHTRTEELIKSLRQGGIIVGDARRFRLKGQEGAPYGK